MANSNGWGDGAANNAIGWGQGANNAIGWGSSHTTSWAGATNIVGVASEPTYDAASTAFFTSSGITDVTQKIAINDLVVGLKADGLWTSMNAIYPFVGGTATTHKWNLKDPRDLDAAYRLQFNGGVTHDVNGITGNGVNSSVFTFNFSAISIGVYSRTSNWFGVAFGSIQYAEDFNENYTLQSSAYLEANQFKSNDMGYITGVAPYNKFYNIIGSNSSAANQLKVYRNGSNVVPTSFANSTPWLYNASFALLASNYRVDSAISGITTAQVFYSNVNLAFATFSNSILDATQNTNLNNRIQAFQTALSRNV